MAQVLRDEIDGKKHVEIYLSYDDGVRIRCSRGKKDVFVAGVYQQHEPSALSLCCFLLRLAGRKVFGCIKYRSYYGAPVVCLQAAPLAIRPDGLFGNLSSAQPPDFALDVFLFLQPQA